MKSVKTILSVIALLFLSSCEDYPVPGQLVLSFCHEVDGAGLVRDAMIYENAAGNVYEVSEIQYFLSDVVLVAADGSELLIDAGGFCHYVDTDIPESLTWEFPDPVAAGVYTELRFVFGLIGEKNIPNAFPNPPESNMVWPYPMGVDQGGYHYMKLNGFWMADEQRTPFNLHLGVGQTYDDNGNVVVFHQNWFEVTLPLASFRLREGEKKNIHLVMNVNEWFANPQLFDLDVYGGKIMKNQEAMNIVKENGATVFSCHAETTP
jgi:hypothetical protein